jgi:hypothetical protein
LLTGAGEVPENKYFVHALLHAPPIVLEVFQSPLVVPDEDVALGEISVLDQRLYHLLVDLFLPLAEDSIL